MSEQILEKKVLALKYRPHRFEDLVGQSTVSQTLSLALDSNRLSHAYLFSGLRGSGKTSTARIMAKALLCTNGPTSKPCEVCDNCNSANTNRHLDIIEMDAASNRGIDDIKDLIEHTKYKPSSARFKVFIIDEVHMLTTQAFNALLKTLEEPPGFVKFILATTDPLKLPATILSRTQHFRFNKIAQSDVIHHLSHILNEENIEFDRDALEIVSRSGQGSLRDTLTLLDQAIIFSKGKITTSSVVDMLGLIDPKVMDNLFSIVLNKGDITTIVKDLEVYEVSQICDEMTIYLKDKMISKDTKFDLLLFDRFFRILSDAKHLLAINSDGGFVLILTLLKMVEATNIKTIDDIINQIEKIEVKEPVQQQKVIQQKVEEEKIEAVKEIVQEVIKANIEEKLEVKQEKSEVKTEEIKNDIPSQDINEFETKIEEVTPFDEVLVQTSGIVSLDVMDSIETVDYSTPFDELPTQKEVIKDEVIEEVKKVETQNIEPQNIEVQTIETKEELHIETIVENEVQVNNNQEIEVVPIEEEIEEKNELYEQLTAKIYDRDYSLGECFEKNFIFNGYEENKLYIISYAQDEDRKFLYKYFGLIRTFAQDVFGNEVELDFKKEEPSAVEKPKAEEVSQKVQEENIVSNEGDNSQESGSMIESIEMSSGCVADMHKSSKPTPSQQELQLNDIINSKMLDKAKELFDIKKITVKSRS